MQYLGLSLRPAGSISLTGNQTPTPCTGIKESLTTGLSGKFPFLFLNKNQKKKTSDIVPLYAFKQICPHLEKERMSFRHTQRNTVKFTLNIIYFLFLLFKLSSGLGSKTVKFDD